VEQAIVCGHISEAPYGNHGNRSYWFSFFFAISISFLFFFPEVTPFFQLSQKTLQAVLAWPKYNLSDRLAFAIT